jgi:hypothetical protein
MPDRNPTIPEYNKNVCPFVRMGSPRPPLRPPGTKEGGQHSLAGEGVVGVNSYDWRESLALCIPCGPAVCITLDPELFLVTYYLKLLTQKKINLRISVRIKNRV